MRSLAIHRSTIAIILTIAIHDIPRGHKKPQVSPSLARLKFVPARNTSATFSWAFIVPNEGVFRRVFWNSGPPMLYIAEDNILCLLCCGVLALNESFAHSLFYRMSASESVVLALELTPCTFCLEF